MPVLRRELHGREELEAHRRHLAMRQQGMRLQGSRPRRRAARTSASLDDARVKPPFRCFTFSLFHCFTAPDSRGSGDPRSFTPPSKSRHWFSFDFGDELFSLLPPDLVCYAYAMVNRQDVPYSTGSPEIR